MFAHSKTMYAVAATLGVLTLGLGATVGEDAATAHATAPERAACWGLPSARCATIRVPLDRTNPRLGTTNVAFALVPRRDETRPALGTVVLSGGPFIAAGAAYVEGLAPLRARRDVLLIDQRGTGRSGPIDCRALHGVVVALTPRRQLLDRIGACGRELGARAGAYGTTDAADDIEAVRAALALDRLDLWGSSYGTYLMTVYAARHPAYVRSMVLHGAYPIAFDPWARDRLGASRRAIGLMCTRTHACRGEAVLRDLARLAVRLRRHPASFTVSAGGRRIPLRVDEAALARLVFAGNDAATYGRIPAAVSSGLDGDLAALRRFVESAAADAYGPTGLAQSFAQQCHEYPRVFSYDDAPAARRTAYARARDAIEPHAFWPFSAAAWTATQLEAVDSCIAWPDDPTAADPLPSGSPLPDVPVLVLAGDLDANTPSPSGREAAARFPHASFVQIPNIGHTPENSACAVALGLRFIATLKANVRACDGTGTPPPVAARAPLRAADLPLVRSAGATAERRALAVVVATSTDLEEQSRVLAAWHTASGLRGGHYVADGKHGIRLVSVRVVRDASVSGVLTGVRPVRGTLRIAGDGVPDGRIGITLTEAGRGRAVGVLGGRPVDHAFRF